MLFESIQNIPGLPSNRVRCIAKDSLGFFWYGTTMGLSRSDGNHYEAFVYEPFDSLSVPAPHITQIIVTKNNLIWCKSDDGMVFFYDANAKPENRFTLINFKLPSGKKENISYILYEDDQLFAWSEDGNFFQIDYQTLLVSHKDLPSFPHRIRQVLYKDSVFWFSSNKGVFKYLYKDGSTDRVILEPELGYDETDSLATGGIAWVGKDSLIICGFRNSRKFMGLVLYNHNSDCVEKYNLPVIGKRDYNNWNVHKVFNLGNGTCFFLPAASAPIFVDFRNRVIDTFTLDWYRKNRLNTESNSDIYVDNDYRVIIASNQGLFIHDPLDYIFKSYIPLESIRRFPNTFCNAYNDPIRQKLIFASNGGILCVYDTIRRDFDHYFTLPDTLFSQGKRQCPLLIPLHSDTLLIVRFGTYKFNLKTYEITQVKDVEPIVPTTDRHAISLNINQTDERIISAGRYLYKYNSVYNRIDKWMHLGELCIHEPVMDIHADNRGYCWVFTFGNTFYKFNIQRPDERYQYTLDMLDVAVINDVYVDKELKIWFATENLGLAVVDIDKHQNACPVLLAPSNGLLSRIVYNVEGDAYGAIWFSQRYGISRLDVSDYSIYNYGKKHGINLPHNMRTGKSTDLFGQLYFSDGIGMVQFNPADFRDKGNPPPVYITDFRISNIIIGSFWKDTTLSLPWFENDLTFTIAAVNHTHASMNRYVYKLEGFSNEWVKLDPQHLILTFTNLKPGKYNLRVKASNHNGIWNEKGISVQFAIAFPFWQTWWFYLLLVITSLGVIYAFFRWRINLTKENELKLIVKEMEAQNAERQRIAQDLHDDIGSQLSTIKMFINAIEKSGTDTEKEIQLRKDTSDLIGKTLQDMRSIIADLSPQTLAAYGYVSAVNEMCYHIKKSSDIEIELDFRSFISDLSVNQQTALFRITQELFNNTIKHSSASEIRLMIESNSDQHVLIYRDNGIGFVNGEVRKGHGFYSVLTRVRFLKGSYTIEALQNEGFFIKIAFPRPK
jgi:signal transduction histidine kinase